MAAPLPTPSGVIHARLIHTLQATVGVGSAFDLAYTGGAPSTTDLEAIAAAIATEWSFELPPYVSQNCNLSAVICTDLANPGTVEGIHDEIVDGTRVGNLPDLSACVVVGYQVARRYRGSRPKSFLPYLVASDVDTGNTWASIPLGELQTALQNFFSALTGTLVGSTLLGNLVGVSYYHGFTVVTSGITGRARNVPTPRAVPLVTAVPSFALKSVIGSQRRRLRAV